MFKKYDVIIIGAGIVGSMVARFLSRYKIDILLIEKEIDVGICRRRSRYLGIVIREFGEWL
jgi:L-2-hydroxyglutarate oxidase LhgO